VTTLVVVSDFVVSLHAEPLGNLAVLARLARELLLDQESFVSRLYNEKYKSIG